MCLGEGGGYVCLGEGGVRVFGGGGYVCLGEGGVRVYTKPVVLCNSASKLVTNNAT